MATNGQYGLQNGDIRATLALSQNEAAYGTTRVLTLPGGRRVTVNIPAGTRPGQEIRLEGQGELASDGRGVGALILTVTIAPAENFGAYPLSQPEMNAPTEAILAPPPPAMTQPAYSGIQQPENFTSYPPQGPASSPPNYFNQQGMMSSQPPYPLYASPAQMPYSATSSQSSVPPGSPRPSRRPLIATIVLAALALLVIIGGFLFYTTVYVPNRQHAQATATAQTQLTGTAQVYASGTAQAIATTKAQLDATSTAVAIPQTRYDQIITQTPVLNDPLSQPDTNNWDTNSNCSFTGGSYHASEPDKGFFYYCIARATNFSNFAFQVKMTFVKGDLGGILFRADADNSKFYLLRIDRAGRYDLYLYVDRNVNHVKNLAGDVTSLINTNEGDTNLISVIARGATIDIYINSKYITTVTDNTLSSGQIGVFADNYQTASEIAFQQAQVWNVNA